MGEDAHGSDILLAQRVLDTGYEGAEDCGLHARDDGVVDGIPRVVGRLVGHDGRNWASNCLVVSSPDVGEVGMREQGARPISASGLALRAARAWGTASSSPWTGLLLLSHCLPADCPPSPLLHLRFGVFGYAQHCRRGPCTCPLPALCLL